MTQVAFIWMVQNTRITSLSNIEYQQPFVNSLILAKKKKKRNWLVHNDNTVFHQLFISNKLWSIKTSLTPPKRDKIRVSNTTNTIKRKSKIKICYDMVVFIEAKVFQLRYECKSLRFLVIEPNIFKNRFGLYLFYANTSLNNCSYLLVNNFKIVNNNNDSSRQLHVQS